jgi:hypothetical protein
MAEGSTWTRFTNKFGEEQPSWRGVVAVANCPVNLLLQYLNLLIFQVL